LGPIGLAVLAFIGYKQTDRQAKFIYRFPCFSIISFPKNELFPKFSEENTKQSCLNSAQAYHTFDGANLFTKIGMAKLFSRKKMLKF